jgi:hypothetical protein
VVKMMTPLAGYLLTENARGGCDLSSLASGVCLPRRVRPALAANLRFEAPEYGRFGLMPAGRQDTGSGS